MIVLANEGNNNIVIKLGGNTVEFVPSEIYRVFCCKEKKWQTNLLKQIFILSDGVRSSCHNGKNE